MIRPPELLSVAAGRLRNGWARANGRTLDGMKWKAQGGIHGSNAGSLLPIFIRSNIFANITAFQNGGIGALPPAPRRGHRPTGRSVRAVSTAVPARVLGCSWHGRRRRGAVAERRPEPPAPSRSQGCT